jgi:hypothetical protein
MKIGNHHVRYSSPYIYKDIDGVTFQFSAATYVDKSKARYVANKAGKGKLALDPALRGVEVQEDGSIRQFKI